MNEISEATIHRLSVYLRFLQRIHVSGIQSISSVELAHRLNVKSSQIRKDLSYFGDFGQKGVGYNVEMLIQSLESILNLKQKIAVCLVGAGHLGQALCNYNLYQNDNIVIEAVFDSNKDKIGMKINDKCVQSINELHNTVRKEKIKMGIICVPHTSAQEVADLLIMSGVHHILNFAPTTLKVPEHVVVREMDFTAELHSLAFFLR